MPSEAEREKDERGRIRAERLGKQYPLKLQEERLNKAFADYISTQPGSKEASKALDKFVDMSEGRFDECLGD